MLGVAKYWFEEESKRKIGFSGLAPVGLGGLVGVGHLGLKLLSPLLGAVGSVCLLGLALIILTVVLLPLLLIMAPQLLHGTSL